MIIRRQLYPHNKVPIKKSDDSGIEMRPIYKNVQPGSVSKLLSTAASGTSIVRDVETLLTPIHELHHRDEMNYTLEQREQASKERTERNLWRNDEVMEMLYTMQQVKALDKLNDKTVKSENVFKDVEVIMHKNGFVKKSHVQIWTKWKFLKSTYMTSRRNRVMPRIIPPQVYEVIHQMITNQNQGYSDCGNSTNGSIDGDTSSLNGGMVISGVEGGQTANGEEDDNFGMAHPIFGFRLGIVKSEPQDTGYEPTKKTGSDNDQLEEQVKEENQNTDDKANKTESPPQLPPRGRGRPPKNPPAATSTPNTTTSPARNIQMPPLRVAPFAKAIHSANALAVNRPPPPLTMPPTPRIQIANLSTLKDPEHIKGMRKILPKPTTPTIAPQTTPIGQSLRLVKEITAQSRSSSSPSPSYPKMKQIPMRQTPYSLRPDRAIPDLEQSPSPPPTPVERQSAKRFEEVPTTKHLTMQSSNASHFQNNLNRKRHLDWLQEPTTQPNKKVKYRNDREDEELRHTSSKSTTTDDDGKHYGKVLQNVIIDLSSSLRKMQTQMMRDFFNKQNELLQKEHEFQLQQDRMIMRAFQQQTQEIMSSVKQLVGTINNNSKETKTNENYRVSTKSKSVRELPEEMEESYEDQQGEEVEDEQQMGQEDGIYTDGEEQQEENDQEENDLEGNEHEENDLEENDLEENDQEDNDQEENEQEENDQEDNDQEDLEQVEHDQLENGFEDEHDHHQEEDEEAHPTVNNEDDEDSDDSQQDPIQMVSSELTED